MDTNETATAEMIEDQYPSKQRVKCGDCFRDFRPELVRVYPLPGTEETTTLCPGCAFESVYHSVPRPAGQAILCRHLARVIDLETDEMDGGCLHAPAWLLADVDAVADAKRLSNFLFGRDWTDARMIRDVEGDAPIVRLSGHPREHYV